MLKPVLCVCLVVFVSLSVHQQDEDSPATELAGLSDSLAYQVEDGRPIDFESEVLLRLAYRATKVSKKNLEKYARYTKGVSLTEVLEKPRGYRFRIFKVDGRAKKITRHQVATGDDGQLVFVVDVVANEGLEIRVALHDVPAAWLKVETLDEPVQATGFFYGTVADTPQSPMVLLIGSELSWLPDTPRAELGVGVAQVLLAGKGVDIGALDVVRKQNTLPLGKADSESFYQFLAATNNTTISELPPPAADFIGLMQKPRSHFGDVVTVTGRVRRCVPVQVDAAIAEKYGIEKYFELDMFMQLGDLPINVKTSADQVLEYRHRFPITVCVTEFGEGQTTESIQNQLVEINGFFYRFWKYKSEFTDRPDGSGGQVSPLIMGLRPVVVSPSGTGVDRLLTISIVCLLFGAGVMLWLFRPGQNRGNKNASSLPDKPDFSGIGKEGN